jgi:hypothetical protein
MTVREREREMTTTCRTLIRMKKDSKTQRKMNRKKTLTRK